MTLTEFNSFDLNKRSDLVWEWGHYLMSRRNETFNIALFLMNDFFVEMHITLSDNKTTFIKGIAREGLHKDFMNVLNHEDPFVKAVFSASSSPSRHS